MRDLHARIRDRRYRNERADAPPATSPGFAVENRRYRVLQLDNVIYVTVLRASLGSIPVHHRHR
jgi:hypothetical protein